MKIAILGCGSIGKRHAKNLIVLGINDMVAFDPDETARKNFSKETGIICYPNLEEVWSYEPDVALVAAPTNLHLELSLQAAANGCHLFIEKPLSHSLESIDSLQAEIDRQNLVIMVGCNMRFHPGPKRIKQMIEENAIGEIMAARIHTGSYLPDWRPGTDYRKNYSASARRGGGVFLDCIHEIDLALWYFGDGRVIGAASIPAESIDLQVEGLAEILIRHQTNVLSSIHLNFIQRDYRRTCQIIGTEKSIYWDFADSYIQVCEPDRANKIYFDHSQEWTINQMYIEELRYFIDCVESGATTFSALEEGRNALEVSLMAKTSAFNNRQKSLRNH